MMSGCEKSSYHDLKVAWCGEGKREDVCKLALQACARVEERGAASRQRMYMQAAGPDCVL
jgi:hypothetical protein